MLEYLIIYFGNRDIRMVNYTQKTHNNTDFSELQQCTR